MRVETRNWSLGALQLLCGVVAIVVFANTATHAFTYDDRAAVAFNKDIQGDTPWMELLQHDFWGSPLRQECVGETCAPSFVVLCGSGAVGDHGPCVSLLSVEATKATVPSQPRRFA